MKVSFITVEQATAPAVWQQHRATACPTIMQHTKIPVPSHTYHHYYAAALPQPIRKKSLNHSWVVILLKLKLAR